MKTLSIVTALLITTLRLSHAETNIVADPTTYLKLQRDVRWNAKRTLSMVQKVQQQGTVSSTSLAGIHSALRETIDAAGAMSIQQPYEAFDSVEGNLLLRNVVRLSSTAELVDWATTGAISSRQQQLLRQIETVCTELAE